MNQALPLLFPVVRGLVLLTLVLLIGCVCVMALVRRQASHLNARALAQSQLWLLILPRLLATFLLALCLARSAAQMLSFMSPGEAIDPDFAQAILAQGSWGTANLVQSIAALLLFAAATLLRTKPRAMEVALLVALPLLIVAQSGLGHGAEESWPYHMGRIMHSLHLVGGGIWLGTLTVLAVAIFPVLFRDHDFHSLADLLRSFSKLARTGAAMVVISGVASGWHYVVSLNALVASGWGTLLLVKLGLFAGVALFGWWNWRVVTPGLTSEPSNGVQRLRRAVTAEILLGLLVLAVTALLVGSPLPQSPTP